MSIKNIKYEECSRKLIEKTPVWEYFLRDNNSGEYAKCKRCDKALKTTGGSTSSLHKHITSIHKIVVKPVMKRCASVSTAATSTAPPEKRRNIQSCTLTNYLIVRDNTLEAVLSRMTAGDGLPFRIFISSIEMRKSLIARGFEVPKSAATIRDMVMKYGKMIREKYKIELQRLKTQENLFSLTFDEWTSCKNRRYLNINAHIKCKFWNLGLVRVRGSLPAECCIKLIEERLQMFGLNLHEDIICITTDGAAVMKKIGKILTCKQQLCFAHAIHLGVLDILYQKPKAVTVGNDDSDCISDDADGDADGDADVDDDIDDDDQEEGLKLELEENKPELCENLDELIRKIRTVVKLFRKSPVKNEILQKYIKEEFGKEMQLLLDVKTRWNSLYNMLERFRKLKNNIRKSLIDLNSMISFEEEEWNIINDLVTTLEPIKLAAEVLCRRDATLLTADTTILFMINNLGCSEFALRMKDSLCRRINERRTKVASLLQYLHKSKQDYAELDPDSVLNFERLTKTSIVTMIIGLSNSVDGYSQQTSESDSDNDAEVGIELSLEEKLNRAINKDVNSKITPPTKTIRDITNVIKKELAIFELEGNRGKNLQTCYQNLLSIPPTSVESERVFSSSGNLCTKIRSSLNDESLDILCFLKSHFKMEAESGL